jgi:hypothetical protein
LALGDETFEHGIAQSFYGFNQWGVKAKKAGILPDPDPGDADFAGKVGFVLGLAGFEHSGVFLGYEDGVAVGLRRFGADSAGFFSRLAVPDDGYDPVVPFALFGQDRRVVP